MTPAAQLTESLIITADESLQQPHAFTTLTDVTYISHMQLPYLVANIVEILDIKPEEESEEDGAATDLDSQRNGKCVVLKTTTRQTIFLPVVGLVDANKLRPGDLVGVNKDSYLILDTLPAEYDSRVKAMEVDEKPTEDYSDVGGLDKQIQELVEAIVLPIQHKDRFKALGIRPPKGVLLYGETPTSHTFHASQPEPIP
jgi:26S proteasome regulatory subunit T5